MPVPQEYDGDGIGIGIPEVTEPLADDRSVLSAAENGALTDQDGTSHWICGRSWCIIEIAAHFDDRLCPSADWQCDHAVR